MKLISSILLATLLSTSAFANIDLNSFSKINTEKYPDIFDAIIIANNHNALYGKCDLNYLNNPHLDYYSNNNGRNPLFLAIPDKDKKMDGLAITTNSEMTEIISVTVVRFMKANLGTIIEPKIESVLSPVISCK